MISQQGLSLSYEDCGNPDKLVRGEEFEAVNIMPTCESCFSSKLKIFKSNADSCILQEAQISDCDIFVVSVQFLYFGYKGH